MADNATVVETVAPVSVDETHGTIDDLILTFLRVAVDQSAEVKIVDRSTFVLCTKMIHQMHEQSKLPYDEQQTRDHMDELLKQNGYVFDYNTGWRITKWIKLDWRKAMDKQLLRDKTGT